MRINRYREFSATADTAITDLVEVAVLSENSELLDNAENILFLEAFEQIINPNPLFPFPEPGDIAGEFKIGQSLPKMHPYGLTPGQLARNLSIEGTVGKGKTRTVCKILECLYEFGIPFLVVSVAKKEYRGLISILPDIHIIRAEDLRLNLLQIEKWSTPQKAINDFVDIYSHGADVMLRSKSIITSNLFELFQLCGGNENVEFQPCLEDLHFFLKYKSITPGFKRNDFLIRNIERIEAILLLSENIFRCSKGFALEKILEYPVILELEGLSDTVVNFIMISLLTKILRCRLEKGVRGKLLHVLVFDEAKRIFSKTQEMNFQMGIPPIDFLVAYARELGEGFVTADQEMSKLTDTLKACTNTKIAFQVNGKEIQETAKEFGLEGPQVDLLRYLPCGTALVKDEKSPRIFLAQMDNIEFPKFVSDHDVSEHSREFINGLNQDVRPRSTLLIESMKKGEKNRKLSKNEEMFLIHIAKRPELTVTERYEAIGFAKYTGDKILKALFVKGFIKKIVVQTGMRGRQPVIVEITEKGKEFLDSAGIKSHAKGKGGAVHQWWQKKIKGFYEKTGNSVEIEPNYGGANTDVLVTNPEGERISIEVALSFKGQINNIQRDLEYFDKVIIAAPSKSLVERIEEESLKLLSKADSDRVSFCLLQSFLEKNNG
jgi:DNA-binding MarR family transcriptional regulator